MLRCHCRRWPSTKRQKAKCHHRPIIAPGRVPLSRTDPTGSVHDSDRSPRGNTRASRQPIIADCLPIARVSSRGRNEIPTCREPARCLVPRPLSGQGIRTLRLGVGIGPRGFRRYANKKRATGGTCFAGLPAPPAGAFWSHRGRPKACPRRKPRGGMMMPPRPTTISPTSPAATEARAARKGDLYSTQS